jgi:hypothetical protein
MTDVVGDALPNWIMAVATTATLVVAILAARYAKSASVSSRDAANSAREQSEIAREQLRHALEANEVNANNASEQLQLARESAALNKTEAEQANRRLAESRLDVLAPSVVARARPLFDDVFVSIREQRGEDWTRISSELSLPGTITDPPVVFQILLGIEIENVSEAPARVDFVDPQGGTIREVRQGDPLIVSPKSTRYVTWERVTGLYSLITEEDIGDAARAFFNVKFWVRDLGMNVRDTYKFNGDLRLFKRDGSRLIVTAEPAVPWAENVATPLPKRSYERLDERT